MAEVGKHITDDELIETVRVYQETGNKTETARRLNTAIITVRRRLATAAKRGMFGFSPVMPEFEVTQSSSQLDADGNVQKQWIKQRPEADNDSFEVPEGHNVKGISALLDANGQVRAQWIKTHAAHDPQRTIETIKAALEFYEPPTSLISAPSVGDDSLLTVYPIPDLHYGMLAWGKETGADYDTAIAKELLTQSMGQLIAQSRPSKRAIVLNLGDWQHTNDQKNATPASGHILDVDSRFEKLLFSGAQLQIHCGDLALQKHEEVTFVNLKGNHDPEVAVALRLALKCFYSGNPRMTVDITPGEFFFHRFGRTLIGAHHGHRAKADKLAMHMATTRREDWGETDYHYFYCGHIHHETAKEVGDVRVETFQTLAPKDAYAASHAYSSGRSLSAITIHREGGEIGRHRVNVPTPRKLIRPVTWKEAA